VEIGPIAGVRPITMVKPSSPSPDPSGVFGVEFRKQAHDEAPARQSVARGLEDEESEDAGSSTEDETSPEEIELELVSPAGPHSAVSFFA